MSRRLFGGASTLLLVCAMVGLSPDTASAQACPSGYTVTTSNTITGEMQSATPWILAMDACQTVAVQITASGATHPSGSANIYFRLRNAAQDVLAETSFVCGISCSGTLPGSNDAAGYPAQGMRGVEGNPADIVVSTGWFNWFGGPVTYTMTITVAPRTGYNLGGTSFANALPIDTGVEQKGSLHWREPGQFYRVHLDVGQLLFLRGEATAHYWWGSHFSIALYDENEQQLLVMVNEAVYGTKTFPPAGTAGLVYRNDGAARDFYLKATAMFYPTWDFKFTAVTPRLTVSSETPTRGDTVTFTVVDAPGGTLSNWRYDITDPLAEATVTRTPNTGADTWPGQLVVSGTAKVTVGLGGFTAELQKHVEVAPRSWSGFPPPEPIRRGTDYPSSTPCGSMVMHYADPGIVVAGPPAEGVALSVSCPWASAAVEDRAEVSGGPNTGVKWLLDVHDDSSVEWGMHEDADYRVPPSAFWDANCGNFMAGPGNTCQTPNGTGFIRAEDFRNGLERHEVGPSNSHYANFKIEISKPDQSFRPNLEGQVAPPSTTMVVFGNNVRFEVFKLHTKIKNALSIYPQPCGPTCDGSCSNHLGNWNHQVGGVYPACPVPVPGPFSLQLFTPKGRVR